MEEKNREKKNRKRKPGQRKRVSFQKKIVYTQIGAITLAVFLCLILGSMALTKVLKGEANNVQNAAAKAQKEQEEKKQEEKEPAGAEQEKEAAAGNGETEKEEGTEEAGNEEQGKEEESMEPVETTQLTVSAIGDCTIGDDDNSNINNNFDAFYIVKKTPAYFFQSVRDLLSQDDLTIANMEGVLTNGGTRAEKTLAFRGAPKYAAVLTEGSVEAANLANDHSKDYGEESYTETIQHLEEAGLTTFGFERTAIREVKGIKVGMVGVMAVDDGLNQTQQLLDGITQVKAEGAQLIIVSFHWGVEYENYPDDTQKTLAHLAVDNGADLVLGHSPHVLQGIEKYNGANIVYSLGNFCYGGVHNSEDKDTMIFQQTFSFANGALVADDVTNIIPCSVSSVAEYDDYQPVPLEGTEKERVLGRIQEYSAALTSQ